MSEPQSPSQGGAGRSIGPLRVLGWLGAAAWWSRKSPASLLALGSASAPWIAVSLLNFPTGGLSLMLCIGLYAQFCLWSTMCASSHFRGEPFSNEKTRAAWIENFTQAKSLALAFVVCAVASLVWIKLCVDLSVIDDMLTEMEAAKSAEAARSIVASYWARDGVDGVALPLAVMQLGLGVVNAVWFSLPSLSLARPELGPRDLLGKGLRTLSRAPASCLTMGLAGSLLAQLGLVFPPAALLAGLWFSACAFARRDLDQAGLSD